MTATPTQARPQLERVRDLAREALAELRSLIFGLRPAELERDGLEGVLRKEATMLQRVHGVKVRVDADGERARRRARVRRGDPAHRRGGAAQRRPPRRRAHGDRPPARRQTTRCPVEVTDDGVGFDPTDPELRSRHLGLTSMEERARELGGTLTLSARPGSGTVVSLEVPVNGA